MELSSHKNGVLPSGAAENLSRSLPVLLHTPATPSSRLTPAAYQRILQYCGVRPDLSGWRQFLMLSLSLLGFLALVAGMIFFIAWNWALMPKIAKFALVELLICSGRGGVVAMVRHRSAVCLAGTGAEFRRVICSLWADIPNRCGQLGAFPRLGAGIVAPRADWPSQWFMVLYLGHRQSGLPALLRQPGCLLV